MHHKCRAPAKIRDCLSIYHLTVTGILCKQIVFLLAQRYLLIQKCQANEVSHFELDCMELVPGCNG